MPHTSRNQFQISQSYSLIPHSQCSPDGKLLKSCVIFQKSVQKHLKSTLKVLKSSRKVPQSSQKHIKAVEELSMDLLFGASLVSFNINFTLN